MAAGGLLTAMLLLSPALVQAGTFNPERDTLTTHEVTERWKSWRAEDGKIKIEYAASEPASKYRGGLHQAWRVLSMDGTPLTQWLLYPNLRQAEMKYSPSGVVVVYDTAEAVDEQDESKRKSAWYRCSAEKTEKLPYYQITDSDSGHEHYGFTVKWSSAPGEVSDGERSRNVGWRQTANANIRQLSIVYLDEEYQLRSKAIQLDPLVKGGVGVAGRHFRFARTDGTWRVFDSHLNEISIHQASESDMGGFNAFMYLDDNHTFWWFTQARAVPEASVVGPWDSYEVVRDHGFTRVLLHQQETTHPGIGYIDNFGRFVALGNDLIALSFEHLNLPPHLMNDERYRSNNPVQVAVVRLETADGEIVKAIPLGINFRQYDLASLSARDEAGALGKAREWLGETENVVMAENEKIAADRRAKAELARKAEEAQRIVAQKEAEDRAYFRKMNEELASQNWETNPTRENLEKCVERAKDKLNFILGKNCARKLGGSDWYTFLEFDTTASGQDLQAAIQDARAHGDTYWINRLQQLRSRTDYNDRLDASVAAANAERQRKSDERAAAGRAFNANMKAIQDSCMRNPASCQGNSSTDWSKESENAHRASDAAIRDMNRRINEAGR
ncbi:hypothetical protein FE236_00345 [Mariprofundus erugo]|uniref:hypothetical protein n=1 Tax=Mariprofundus erugo TaxID=2528639 RepID=UPI0010FEF7BC|nr:hypothetical protein [Mariprofundus erugo]TLS78243.1 hypothetical protein FE236_00345 [Mariprofundus erugo]